MTIICRLAYGIVLLISFPGVSTAQTNPYLTNLDRITSNPNFQYCVSAGWTSQTLMPKCEQLMSAITGLEAKADYCFRAKDWSCTISSINDLYRLAAGNAKSFYQRGFAYYSLGKLQEGISDFRKALQFDPNNREIQNALKASESAEQSVRPIKNDIRGFRIGMTPDEVQIVVKTMADRECPSDLLNLIVQGKADRYLPCYDAESVVLNAAEGFYFRYSQNLQSNVLQKVKYSFFNAKPYDQMLSAVIEQFGVSAAANKNIRHQQGIWDTWDLPDFQTLTFSGGGSQPYSVELECSQIMARDKSALKDSVAAQPPPKF